jgi:hypothetical protein
MLFPLIAGLAGLEANFHYQEECIRNDLLLRLSDNKTNWANAPFVPKF